MWMFIYIISMFYFITYLLMNTVSAWTLIKRSTTKEEQREMVWAGFRIRLCCQSTQYQLSLCLDN